jgi:hypothetical protein
MPSPNEIDSPDDDPRQQAADLVARVSDEQESSPSGRTRSIAALAKALVSSARAAGAGAVASGRWLADVLIETAPRLRIRDRATLLKHHPDQTDEEIAESLIRTAAKSAAAVGAGWGALTAVEFTAPPTLLSLPVQLAIETLVVAAIEVKLIAELHELYGRRPQGGGSPILAYTSSWASRRGVDPLDPAILTVGLSTAAKLQVRRRLLGRAARNLTTLGPLLTGAIAGSLVNHRETRRVGTQLRDELRPSSVTSGSPDQPVG